MADVAIIIGNGFDLDMEIPSKYSDFIESPEWKPLAHTLDMFPFDDYRSHSLIYHLQCAANNKENWFDIEQEIYQFVQKHKECTGEEIRDIKSEFERLKDALVKYLKRISEKRIEKTEKLSYQLYYYLQACPLSIVKIYFNYTNPALYMPTSMYYNHCTFTYVHGSLKDNDIVLGCDLQKGDQVNRQLSFMYKYNMLHKANHIARNILEAKEIIFFGHSINEMDFCYFREFFKIASAAPNPIRHLTIITYDENSERDIKDNIRNQGISVSDLYSNLWTFDFIHTKKFYEKDESEVKKWNEMMNRLLAKDRHGI